MGYYRIVNKRKYYDPVAQRWMADHDEYIPRRKKDQPSDDPGFNDKPVPPDSRDTNPECEIFTAPFAVNIYEEHYVSAIEDYTQTRTGAKPNQEFDFSADPNIGKLITDLGFTYDPEIGWSGINGPVNFETIIDVAQLSLDKRRELGGAVTPVGTSPEIIYDAILKTTDPTRDGPVWDSNEVDTTQWQIFHIPKEQTTPPMELVVKACDCVLEWTGLDPNTVMPDVEIRNTEQEFIIMIPPFPTLIQSCAVTITVFLEEKNSPQCRREVAFHHWVDYATPNPDLKLAIWDQGPEIVNADFSKSYQTEYGLINSSTKFPSETNPLVLLNNPTAACVILTSPTYALTDDDLTQAYNAGSTVPVAQKIANILPTINDWIVTFGKDDSEYKNYTPMQVMPAGFAYEVGTWIKYGLVDPINKTIGVLIDHPVYTNCICEHFTEANPRTFPNPLRNPLWDEISLDYNFDNTSVLSKHYAQASNYPPSNYANGWTPKGKATRKNPGSVPADKTRNFRAVVPISSSNTNVFQHNFYKFFIPQSRWGKFYVNLESDLQRQRVTIAFEIKPQTVTTTRGGMKIAGTDTNGTSQHTTTTLGTFDITFDWEFENCADATVFVPFGYNPESQPFTYSVSPGTNTYTISANLSTNGIHRGAVDVRHFGTAAGYRHFFEITVEDNVPLVPYSFTSYEFIPRFAVNSLGNSIDEYYQTYTLSLNQAWNIWTTWKGGRSEPSQIFECPYFNGNSNALPTIYLANNATLPTGTFTVTASNGYSFTTELTNIAGTDTILFANASITQQEIKAALPRGFQYLNLELTSQPRRAITGTANLDPNFYQFTSYNVTLPEGATIENRSARDVHFAHDTISALDSIYQNGPNSNIPDGSATCPNNSYYTAYINVGSNAKKETLCVYFQASLALQDNPEVNVGNPDASGEFRMKGCDINAPPYACAKVPTANIFTLPNGQWKVRYRRIPATALIVAKFSWWEIP